MESWIQAPAISVDTVVDPGIQWHWLSGNFTLDTSGLVELDVEFHMAASEQLHAGQQYYRQFINKLPKYRALSWVSSSSWILVRKMGILLCRPLKIYYPHVDKDSE